MAAILHAAASTLVKSSALSLFRNVRRSSSTMVASTTTALNYQLSELSLPCADGIQLAAQSYRTNTLPHDIDKANRKPRRILCLHGWMDNCRSFHYLAPYLMTNGPPELDVELVALDFPGHGRSSHKSLDGPPTMLAESAFYVAEAVRQLQWQDDDPFAIIGHSMGAAVGCLYAAAFPEQVHRLVLLDGAGPLARKTEDVAKHVRHHVQRRQLFNNRPPRVYPSLQVAIETRCQTARNFPGNQWLSEAAAREMVRWGTVPVPAANTNTSSGIQFRHDPRLQWPSLQYFTQEQTDALYRDIQCPTALLTAQDGWPFDEERVKGIMALLQPVVCKKLPGSHHFHADPETAEQVADEVLQFLLFEKH